MPLSLFVNDSDDCFTRFTTKMELYALPGGTLDFWDIRTDKSTTCGKAVGAIVRKSENKYQVVP